MRVLHPKRRELPFPMLTDASPSMLRRRVREGAGFVLLGLTGATAVALATWSVADPSFSHATRESARNLLGTPGAAVADLLMQLLGLAAVPLTLVLGAWGWRLAGQRRLDRPRLRVLLWLLGSLLAAGAVATLPRTASWPLPTGLGGALGDLAAASFRRIPLLSTVPWTAGPVLGTAALVLLFFASGFGLHRSEAAAGEPEEAPDEEERGPRFVSLGLLTHWALSAPALLRRTWKSIRGTRRSLLPSPLSDVLRRADREAPDNWDMRSSESFDDEGRIPFAMEPALDEPQVSDPVSLFKPAPRPAKRRPAATARGEEAAPVEPKFSADDPDAYVPPSQTLLAEPKKTPGVTMSADALDQNARALEGVLEDFGVRGQIINVRPGPVVTLYELEPAPGIKSSRVIGLADDIARSMSAISARVAVVPGRNVIGIELPNPRRETVYLRELLAAESFGRQGLRLPLALGKNIGGEPIVAELARMPHLLIAGTTGSGKSVAINTMILSLLYRLTPQECRLIMIDPKMLELSIYDGIPHLLSPVVTDPKKAVVALKWTVREMEDRYRKMSKLGVRNIDGFNARVAQAAEKGEAVTRTVQTGFDKRSGEAIYEQEVMDLAPMPYIVVIVDEMADLMMVAGKDIEGAIQRLAQMARAAGIHIIMATQRPSVDVITGTIKANFPTRISFQVTSKIDSRTILGEQGAEQLLGQGDMLHMAGGGRISRVHGPFVSDEEVERVVAYLKTQGSPDYLDAVTTDDAEAADPEEGGGGAVFDKGAFGEEGGDLYDQALSVVLRDRKCSTSYIQRRLQIGYNRAASLVERMEKEGVVGPSNHAGKREILLEPQDAEL